MSSKKATPPIFPRQDAKTASPRRKTGSLYHPQNTRKYRCFPQNAMQVHRKGRSICRFKASYFVALVIIPKRRQKRLRKPYRRNKKEIRFFKKLLDK